MSDLAVSHFKLILAPQYMLPIAYTLQWFFNLHDFRFNASQKEILSSPPSLEEITKIMFKLNPNKSPGPYGFSSSFLRSAWSIVGSEVTEVIQRFFTTGFLLTSTNATTLTMVPKKPGAFAVSDYRPISCCNTTYKVISKALVTRLKTIFSISFFLIRQSL